MGRGGRKRSEPAINILLGIYIGKNLRSVVVMKAMF
jgi:hypothetical protein